ncbi:hypothetical protein [Glycomyces tarimensis]
MRDDLPRRLRVTAEEFQPDSERMWERLSSGMGSPETVKAEPLRGRFRVPHLAFATSAVVAIIAAIVVVGYGQKTVDRTPPATGTSSDSPDERDSPGPADGRPEDADELDFLMARPSINDNTENFYWSEAKLVMTTEEPLTELTVEVYIVNAVDLQTTGSWTTAEHYFGPPEVIEEDGYLIYRWTLTDGRTVEPGEYTFAGQHNHTNGIRDAAGDYFVFEAASDAGEGTVIGGFEPQD